MPDDSLVWFTLECSGCGATWPVTDLSEPVAPWFDKHRPCMTGEQQEIDVRTQNLLREADASRRLDGGTQAL